MYKSQAQPAEQLRPLWTRQQEQSAALAQTHRQVEEVNTRLQDRLRLRVEQRGSLAGSGPGAGRAAGAGSGPA
ncbi:hypothetical protein OO18_29255, partial [Raoultella ornithinolytica]